MGSSVLTLDSLGSAMRNTKKALKKSITPHKRVSPSLAIQISTINFFFPLDVGGGIGALGSSPERALYRGTARAMATALARTSRLRQTS